MEIAVNNLDVDAKSKIVSYLKKDEKTNTALIVPQSTEGAKRAELDYEVLDTKDNLHLLFISCLQNLIIFSLSLKLIFHGAMPKGDLHNEKTYLLSEKLYISNINNILIIAFFFFFDILAFGSFGLIISRLLPHLPQKPASSPYV